ncbi:MAG: TVP38/TMEM64 family protein [bacterium]|nr:TVP38/TMEM64 family protein [bacterium]
MTISRELSRRLVRPVLLLGLLAIGLVVIRVDGVASWFERDRLMALTAQAGPWGPVVFACLKILSVVLALPSAPVTMAGGFLFGPVLGTVVNVLAATAGASLTFFIGRFLGRDGVQRVLPRQLQALDERLVTQGFRVILSLRLVPLVPFNGLNYGAGLTRVAFRDYLAGTLLGITPGAAVFTTMGHSAAEASVPGMAIGLGALGVLSLIPVFWRPVAPVQVDASPSPPAKP